MHGPGEPSLKNQDGPQSPGPLFTLENEMSDLAEVLDLLKIEYPHASPRTLETLARLIAKTSRAVAALAARELTREEKADCVFGMEGAFLECIRDNMEVFGQPMPTVIRTG
jgi:hypothetical protein